MEKKLAEIIEDYRKFYPQYTLESLTNAVRKMQDRFGKIDAITVDYFMRNIDAGGLGYGVMKYSWYER